MVGFTASRVEIIDRRTYTTSTITVDIDDMSRIVIGAQSDKVGTVLQLSVKEAIGLVRAINNATTFLQN